MNNAELVAKRYFHLDDRQKLHWLRLIRSQNVGPVIFRQLISHYGSAEAAIDALPELAARGGAAAKIKVCSLEDAEREFSRCENAGGRFIALGEPEYPSLLRTSDQAPPLLAVIGDLKTITRPMVAIVGSRNASISGMKLTERFASGIGEEGYVVASGLARGIDTAAHRAALQTGTVAVFAGGVDHVFPPENRELAATILETNGAIVSEMPMGWRPRAKDFPRRNRIVTGLAIGVVVVEAAMRSGSLISARLANEMGRLVMAVPGSPLDPRSEGTNQLIRSGATLITSADDIWEAIRPLDGRVADFQYDIFEKDEHYLDDAGRLSNDASDSLRARIIGSLGAAPTEIDDIIRYSGARPGEVQLVLMELTLAGRIERHAGNRVSLIDP